MVSIELPWPPSVNTYWRHTSRGHYISSEGRKFKQAVQYLLHTYKPTEERVAVLVEAFPPDRRNRDIDNLLKATLDSIEGRLFVNDSQIDDLRVVRREVVKDGKIRIHLETIKA